MADSNVRNRFRERISIRQAQKATNKFFGIVVTAVAIMLIVAQFLRLVLGWNIFPSEVLIIVLGAIMLIGLFVYLAIRWRR